MTIEIEYTNGTISVIEFDDGELSADDISETWEQVESDTTSGQVGWLRVWDGQRVHLVSLDAVRRLICRD